MPLVAKAPRPNDIAIHMYSSIDKSQSLSYQGVYPCPVCRFTQLKAMSLMDAMACDCCHHIFTPDLERQQIQMVDRQPPLIWHWNGRHWKGAHLEGVEWGWTYWLLALGFVILPSAIVGLSAYMFPAESGSTLDWLPIAWTGLTFLSHLGIIGWLAIEFYQFPVRAYLRAWQRQLLSR